MSAEACHSKSWDGLPATPDTVKQCAPARLAKRVLPTSDRCRAPTGGSTIPRMRAARTPKSMQRVALMITPPSPEVGVVPARWTGCRPLRVNKKRTIHVPRCTLRQAIVAVQAATERHRFSWRTSPSHRRSRCATSRSAVQLRAGSLVHHLGSFSDLAPYKRARINRAYFQSPRVPIWRSCHCYHQQDYASHAFDSFVRRPSAGGIGAR